jgi:hypothetical protein
LKLANFYSARPVDRLTEKIAVAVNKTACSFVNLGSTTVLSV